MASTPSLGSLPMELLTQIARNLVSEWDQNLVDLKSFSLVSRKVRQAAVPVLFKLAIFAIRPDILPFFSPTHLTKDLKTHVRELVFETSFYNTAYANNWRMYHKALRLWHHTEYKTPYLPDSEEDIRRSEDGHKMYSYLAEFEQKSRSIGLTHSLRKGLRDMSGLQTIIFTENTSVSSNRFEGLLVDNDIPISTMILPRSGCESDQFYSTGFNADTKDLLAGPFYAFRESSALIQERTKAGDPPLALRRLEIRYALCHPVFDMPESLNQDAMRVFALLEHVSFLVGVQTLRRTETYANVPATEILSTKIVSRLLDKAEKLKTVRIGTDYDFIRPYPYRRTLPRERYESLTTDPIEVWGENIPRGKEVQNRSQPGLGLFLPPKRWNYLTTAQLQGMAAHETEVLAFILTHASTLKSIECKKLRLMTGTWASLVQTLHHERTSIQAFEQLDFVTVTDKDCEHEVRWKGTNCGWILPYSYFDWDGTVHQKTTFVDRRDVEVWESKFAPWNKRWRTEEELLDRNLDEDDEDFDYYFWV